MHVCRRLIESSGPALRTSTTQEEATSCPAGRQRRQPVVPNLECVHVAQCACKFLFITTRRARRRKSSRLDAAVGTSAAASRGFGTNSTAMNFATTKYSSGSSARHCVSSASTTTCSRAGWSATDSSSPGGTPQCAMKWPWSEPRPVVSVVRVRARGWPNAPLWRCTRAHEVLHSLWPGSLIRFRHRAPIMRSKHTAAAIGFFAARRCNASSVQCSKRPSYSKMPWFCTAVRNSGECPAGKTFRPCDGVASRMPLQSWTSSGAVVKKCEAGPKTRWMPRLSVNCFFRSPSDHGTALRVQTRVNMNGSRRQRTARTQ